MNSIADLLEPNGEFGSDPIYQSMGSFVQGIVSENCNKKFAGLLKVEFTAWKDKKNICEWIPMLRPYAGDKYGVYNMPEVGDIVLVGFIGTGFKRPFVAGCLFPANAALVNDNYIDQNTARRLHTKGGIDLLLSDEKNKLQISAVTPKGLTADMAEEKETIRLTDKNGNNCLLLDCKNGEITLTAKSKMTLKCGKCTITLDGQSGQLSLKCDQFAVKATQKAELSANQAMNVTGGMLTVEGKQMATVKSSAMTEIKGSMVKIN